MRRFLAPSLGFAVALQGSLALAQSQPEVIARSAPQQKAAAEPAPVAQVGYRAQVDDKPAPMPQPAPSTPTPLPTPSQIPMDPFGNPGPIMNSAPLPQGQMPQAPMPTTTTVMPSAPCANCTAAPFDGTMGPLPSGVFVGSGGPGNSRWYITGEYLYWWLRDGGLPVLVTTGPTTDPVPGVLDPVLGPNTRVLFGNDNLDTQGRSGVRVEAGRWFGPCQSWAIEGGVFFLGQRASSFHAEGNGQPGSTVIARPFFEANRRLENVEYVNFPGVLRGAIDIRSTSDFYGANLDWRRHLWCGQCSGLRIDGQVGFRYLHLDEDLTIDENSTFVSPGFVTNTGTPIPVGATSAVQDRFSTNNDFYGGMFGLVTDWNRGRWNLQLTTRVSVGTTHERVEVAGGQQIQPPALAPPGNFAGGLLARPTNVGVFQADKFAVVPEVGFNVGYQINPHWKIFAGYNFLYWSNMVRVGDQIDRTVNLNGIPFALQPGQRDNLGRIIPAGDARPAPVLKETDFWAQGISAGLQWTW
ncbi:MAG: BBP7 family outer membrane beta-barrel protein [Gemmataceae bacterium]